MGQYWTAVVAPGIPSLHPINRSQSLQTRAPGSWQGDSLAKGRRSWHRNFKGDWIWWKGAGTGWWNRVVRVQIINFSNQPEISSVFSEKHQEEKIQPLLFSRCAGNGSFPFWEDSGSAETLEKEFPVVVKPQDWMWPQTCARPDTKPKIWVYFGPHHVIYKKQIALTYSNTSPI